MRIRLVHLGLSLIVTMGIWTKPLPAQKPELVPPPTTMPPYTSPQPQVVPSPMVYPQPPFLSAYPGVMVVPPTPYEPALRPPSGMAIVPAYVPKSKGLPCRVLNHFGMGCQANPDGNVGNFYSEMRFIFGSSRSFFNEPCFPGFPCHARP